MNTESIEERPDCCESCKHWTRLTGGYYGRCAILPGETKKLHTCGSFIYKSGIGTCETCKWWAFVEFPSNIDINELSRITVNCWEEGIKWGHCQYEPKALWHESTYFCSKWVGKK